MHPSHRMLYTIGALLCVVALTAACGDQAPIPSASPGATGVEEPGDQTVPAAPATQPPATEFTSPLEHEASPLPTATDPTEPQAVEQPAKPIETLPPLNDPGSGTAPLTGEVPQDLLDAVFDDLSDRLDVSREAVVVEQAGAVVWRDGSLGCPQPGMMYTQALVPGYRIILTVGEETLDYHASDGGYFILCAEGMAQEPLPPDEGSVPLVDQ